ncbi:hypothetical protein SAMN05880590_105282 [Rhizobium sp. RU35A]|uniref:hypothetical protein n=1 Tax=Rhizobium sp. RU35A TaxID=1907414 RepID=UPI0009546072|nr:hypothetical protein [Rhizobium sp. RU35A]SIQ58903.1 hypothetical protein SAMN05880590_105282 [Rhizobium sp. RU35A]
MTSLRLMIERRKPRRLAVTVALACVAIALLSGNAVLLRTAEPGLVRAEEVASAGAFRILAPQRMVWLAGLSTQATATSFPETGKPDDLSCLAARAATKTGRHVALDPASFCRLQYRLLNAELIGRRRSLELAFRTRPAASRTAANHGF